MKSMFYKIFMRFHVVVAMVAAAVMTACHSDGPDNPATHRTVLVYMVADNSLGRDGYDQADLQEMIEGARAGALGTGRLIVYHCRRGTASGIVPQLLEITPRGVNVLKEYPDNPEIYSTDVARMRQVLADVRSYAPADDYGLILWSHGSGWKEGSQSRAIITGETVSAPVQHDFGEDRGVTMKVSSLASALDGFDHSFIYFDCCFMMTVEVMWELRSAAPVIAGSGIELPADGMPYQKNLPVFFAKGQVDLVKAASNTFEYYDCQEGTYRTCAMTVVRTQALPALAEASKAIFATVTEYQPELSRLQRYERPGFVATIYDFEQYMRTICDDEALLATWKAAFDDAVVYSAFTPWVFNDLKLDYYGLGSFVIMDSTDKTFRNYNSTAWYNDVVKSSPLLK